MAESTGVTTPSRCLSCGFEAEAGGSEWKRVESPPLGSLTQCPECGSTDVMSGW